MTHETRHNQPTGEPTPDPRLERLIREAVASQNVPLDRQRRHLERIARHGEGRTRTATLPASGQDGRRSTFTDDDDAAVLPASSWSNGRTVASPVRTRARQVTELAMGFVGFVLVAALLVALFREDPDDTSGLADSAGTATATAASTATTATTAETPPTTAATATTSAVDIPVVTPTPGLAPTSAPTEPTAEPTVETPEIRVTGYGVLTRWDAKVYDLAALTVGPDDRVYAVDIQSGRVSIYTLEETLVGTIDLTGGVPLIGERYDLAVDRDGTLYLLDSAAGRVYRYAADGSVIGDWDGSSDAGAGALVDPLAIAVDADGLIYIAEELPNGHGRIRIFTTSGVEAAVWIDADWTGNGVEPLPSGLQAIEVVADAVYVLADSVDRAGSVLQFDRDGTFVNRVVRFTYSMDEAQVPIRRSFAVDAAGVVVNVDPGTGAVTGQAIMSGTVLYWTPDEIDGDIERTPNIHVAVDSRGYVYILQSERVLMTVLAPLEVIEAARQPTFGVSPLAGICGDELTAHGSFFRAGDQVTIQASVADSDELVEVGRATVIQEEGNPAPHFDAPISLESLGVCEGEIDRDGVDITFVARAEGDPKQANSATVTLFSSSRIPTLTLTPTSGDCDTHFTATGADFVPGTSVTLMLGGHQFLPLAHRVAVDENGAFAVELSAAVFPECTRSPDNPLTQELTVLASTEWPDKRGSLPYPSAQATFTLDDSRE